MKRELVNTRQHSAATLFATNIERVESGDQEEMVTKGAAATAYLGTSALPCLTI